MKRYRVTLKEVRYSTRQFEAKDVEAVFEENELADLGTVHPDGHCDMTYCISVEEFCSDTDSWKFIHKVY